MAAINREHEVCILAVHKKKGKMFGGKKNGSHIGYPKIGFLKAALRNVNEDPKDYDYVELLLDEHGEFHLNEIEQKEDNDGQQN